MPVLFKLSYVYVGGCAESDTEHATAGRNKMATRRAGRRQDNTVSPPPPPAAAAAAVTLSPAMKTRCGGKREDPAPEPEPEAPAPKRIASKGAKAARSHSAAAGSSGAGHEGTASVRKAPSKGTSRGNRATAARSHSAAARSHSVAEVPAESGVVQAPPARTGRQGKRGASAAVAQPSKEASGPQHRSTSKPGQSRPASAKAATAPVEPTRPVSARRAAKLEASLALNAKPAAAAPPPAAKAKAQPAKRARPATKPAEPPAAQQAVLPAVAAAAAVQLEDTPSKRVRKPSVRLNRDLSPVRAASRSALKPAPAAAAQPQPQPSPAKRARKAAPAAPSKVLSAEDAAAIEAAQTDLDRMLPRTGMSTRRSAATGSAGTASGAAGTSAAVVVAEPIVTGGRQRGSPTGKAQPSKAAKTAATQKPPPQPQPEAPVDHQPRQTARQKAGAARKSAAALAVASPQPSSNPTASKAEAKKVVASAQPKKQQSTPKSAAAASSRSKPKSLSNTQRASKAVSSGEEAGSAGARKSSRTPIPKKLFEPDRNFPSNVVVPGPVAALAAATAAVAPATGTGARKSPSKVDSKAAQKLEAVAAPASVAEEGIAKSRSRRRTTAAPVPDPETVAAVMGGASTSAGAARRSAPSAVKAAMPQPRRSKKLAVKVAGAAQAGTRKSTAKRASTSSKRTSAKRSSAAAAELEGEEDSQVTHVAAGAACHKQTNDHATLRTAEDADLLGDSSEDEYVAGGAPRVLAVPSHRYPLQQSWCRMCEECVFGMADSLQVPFTTVQFSYCYSNKYTQQL